MKRSLIIILIFILFAAFLYWRYTESPEVRETRLRTALENHDEKTAVKIINQH